MLEGGPNPLNRTQKHREYRGTLRTSATIQRGYHLRASDIEMLRFRWSIKHLEALMTAW
jgi:hypothetical protein